VAVVQEAGVQAHHQKFLSVENPGKITENPGENGAQCSQKST